MKSFKNNNNFESNSTAKLASLNNSVFLWQEIRSSDVKISPIINELELLERLRGGDMRAFEQIYEHYSTPLYWLLKNMIKDQDEANEMLQDVFVRVWERRAQINPEKLIIGYLRGIAKNMVRDHFRKLVLIANAHKFLQKETTEISSATEDQIEAAETQALIGKAIEQLPPQQKIAFQLCKIEGKSHIEAAEIMNISPNTVNNHVVKASTTIKLYLDTIQNSASVIVILHIISIL